MTSPSPSPAVPLPVATSRAADQMTPVVPEPRLNALGSEPGQAVVKTVSVVIPAMNEERNIAWVLERIPPYVDEVLLVDGHSTDDTVAVARLVRPHVRVIPQRGCGKGAAMRTGFEAAVCDYVVVLDADGSMDPGEIDYYVEALDEGYDLVKGSRQLPGGGSLDLTPMRRWGNHVLFATVNITWGSEFTDLCYGYLAFRRERLDQLALTGRGFEIETEIVLNAIHARLRIAEVPTIELLRHYGTSHLHVWSDGRRILGYMTRALLHPRSRPVTDRINRRALTAAIGPVSGMNERQD
jgi:glycosyltransferase involved in cell wall biosynthesis